MKTFLIILIPFVLGLTQSHAQTIKKAELPVSINATVVSGCINKNTDLKLDLLVTNNSREDRYLHFNNVIWDCKVVDAKGDTLRPNYNIGHSRDWAERSFYLIKAHDSIHVVSQIQKLFYYDLQPGQQYQCSLTYMNIVKKIKDKTIKKSIRLYKGTISIPSFYFETCKN